MMTPDNLDDPVEWVEFLVASPPGHAAYVSGATNQYQSGWNPVFPDIEIYCSNPKCNGPRFFSCKNHYGSSPQTPKNVFVSYLCKNCNDTQKDYALRIEVLAHVKEGDTIVGVERAFKLGEFPALQYTLPSLALKLLGPDQANFMKGKRCEVQGMGIAAYAYYRRVIENQKDRLFDEIIKVSTRLGYNEAEIARLESAKQETQFSKGVAEIKDLIPKSLLIQGHSPLTLLHRSLSDGLHARTDEECLELARTIRLLLVELAERLHDLMRDQRELEGAISKLLNSNPS